MSAFGAELRRRRLSAGMSLTRLAATIHFTKGYLSKVENGKVRVNRSLAEACDRILEAKGELLALATEAPAPTHRGAVVGLPNATRHFVGRKAEFDSLLAMLTGHRTARLCVLHGLAGVGKTALAVAVAHAAVDRFPDGCHFFDLRGYLADAPALDSSEVIYRVLTLLGVAGETIPADVDGRANLLQDCLRDSRVLLVLDNVSGARQLDRLLPSAPGCRVLVTSRGRLPALDEAWHLHVQTLAEDEAMALFRSVAGDCSSAVEDDVRAILASCGMLPLAIRIAAARVAVGGWTVTRLRERLSDEARRLAALDNGERGVAAAFTVSYRMRPPAERRLFGLLALHAGRPAELASVSALCGIDDVDDLVDGLHDAHLLTRRDDGHVETHDLVRVFAGQYALPEIAVPEQNAAAARLGLHLLGRVVAADEFLEPHRFRPTTGERRPDDGTPFDDLAGALGWLRDQWPVLVAGVELADSRGLHTVCWQLAFSLRTFFYREKLLGPWLRTHRRAVDAAEAAGDLRAVGMTLNSLGMAHLEDGDVAAAIDCHRRAHTCFTEVHDERGATDALSSLAWARLYQGEFAESLRSLTSVLAIYRAGERTRNVLITLRGIALALTALDRFTEALARAEEARALARLPVDELMCVNCLAWVHFRAGRLDEARARYLEAAELAEIADSDHERARVRTGLGNIAATRGDLAAAADWWERAEDYQTGLSPVTQLEAAFRKANWTE